MLRTKKRIMKQQPEFQLQKQVCQYLNVQFPEVLFLSDTIASLYLTVPQKVRNKSIQKNGFHCPDLIIFKPNSKYKGLFIELKVKSPYKKDGTLRKDEHLENQQRTIFELQKLGYFAVFAVGFDEAKKIIDEYLREY